MFTSQAERQWGVKVKASEWQWCPRNQSSSQSISCLLASDPLLTTAGLWAKGRGCVCGCVGGMSQLPHLKGTVLLFSCAVQSLVLLWSWGMELGWCQACSCALINRGLWKTKHAVRPRHHWRDALPGTFPLTIPCISAPLVMRVSDCQSMTPWPKQNVKRGQDQSQATQTKYRVQSGWERSFVL